MTGALLGPGRRAPLLAMFALLLATLPVLWPPSAAALPAAAVLFSSAVSAVGGFAFSALSGPLLTVAGVEPVTAVRLMLVASIGGQLLGLWLLRREIALPPLLPFLAGGLATLPLGQALLLHLPPGRYQAALGAVLLLYGAWMLLRPPQPLALGPRAAWLGDLLAGALGGLTGGLAAFPGAAVVPWCGLRGWSKQRQRAVFQPYILVMQLAGLALLGLHAPAGQALPWSAFGVLPPALLGTSFGIGLFGRLSDRRFFVIVHLLLLASGLALLGFGR
ncbi:sulfite exporter TauE/SafE family protein [Siccirubricoccus sp. KC 17139]|uniref:Probable membrane transporter protein n=1 Tax=Siccirubricoccus soli TaxID=2899147 RepID=A0ABT1D1G8_9PROT|nr:sulfite exporter TauE/SafE family protein [Siccirubricoccus soli]MCO6415763.1 sulfite exporter TauE/SafE family protein [Siccirubricoccus soli]MCP2681895.1 sulfite exporter TauE/SafE family protein [Siccirubricoccus soli]